MFAEITKKIEGGMLKKDAVASYIRDQGLPVRKHFARVDKAYTREKQKLIAGGNLEHGHGNAMFTNKEEFVILSALLEWSEERKSGVVGRVVKCVEQMGALSRWERPGEDNSLDALRKRAFMWADKRVSVWKERGFVDKERPTVVGKDRSDTAQHVADIDALCDRLAALWTAQGHVPLENVKNCDEFLVRVFDKTCQWVRIVAPDDDRPQVKTDTRGHECFSVLLFTNGTKDVEMAIVCIKSPKRQSLDDDEALVFEPTAKLPIDIINEINKRFTTADLKQPYIYFCATESGFFDANLFESVRNANRQPHQHPFFFL